MESYTERCEAREDTGRGDKALRGEGHTELVKDHTTSGAGTDSKPARLAQFWQ